MKAMILAAGRGKRLQPLTDECPKPLLAAHPDGTSFIERILLRLAKARFTDIVINVSWLRESIMQRLGSGERYGVRITYSDEGGHALDTGGGIKQALRYLGKEPFLVVNSDIYTDWTPGTDRSDVLRSGALAHLLLAPPPGHSGDLDVHKGLIMPGKQWTFCGIGYYRPELFAGMPRKKFSLLDALTPAITQKRVSGEVYRGLWMDIGTPEKLERVRRLGDQEQNESTRKPGRIRAPSSPSPGGASRPH